MGDSQRRSGHRPGGLVDDDGYLAWLAEYPEAFVLNLCAQDQLVP